MPIQPLQEQDMQEEKPLLVSVSQRQLGRAWSRGLAPTTMRCSRRICMAASTQDTLNSSFLCNTASLEQHWITSRNQLKMPPQKAALYCSSSEHLQRWVSRNPFRNQPSSFQISNTQRYTVPPQGRNVRVPGLKPGLWASDSMYSLEEIMQHQPFTTESLYVQFQSEAEGLVKTCTCIDE